jgi:protein gp37
MPVTSIEWTEATWNPIAGCSVLSPGCTNCYAMRTAARLARIEATAPIYAGLTQPSKAGPVWTGRVEVNEKALLEPLRRRKPTMYFVNSMSDLFHESVPDETIDRVFAVMALCPQHTFQVLTKRSARMRSYFQQLNGARLDLQFHLMEKKCAWRTNWPLPNVWLGVSVEDQKRADERIPDLLATPAALRFLSCEPLLGPVDLRGHISEPWEGLASTWTDRDGILRGDLTGNAIDGIEWVIVGGESGPGARPMHPDWARLLRDQCATHDVPFFFKQWGEWAPHRTGEAITIRQYHDTIGYIDRDTGARKRNPNRFSDHTMRRVGKKAAGRTLDGVTHDAMPQVAHHG